MKIYIVIPVKNPDNELLKIVKFFQKRYKIIIINDGSTLNTNFFRYITRKNVEILKNNKNMGKGYSLKKGIKRVIKRKIYGIIQADGDGQHSINDIQKVINAFKKDKSKIIIGQRELNFKNTPLRNYIGNKIASFIFNYSRKNKILDTQCGLRAIPYSRFSECLKFKENKYAYETKFLLKFSNNTKNYKLIKIRTIYKKKIISYFNPLNDSITILNSLFK